MLRVIDKVNGFAIQKSSYGGVISHYQTIPMDDKGVIINNAALSKQHGSLKDARDFASGTKVKDFIKSAEAYKELSAQ